MLELVLLDGSERSFVIEEGTELRVGAAAHCGVRLSALDVSRAHALITRQGGKILLLDLGSTNGTFVNGRRVKEAELAAGDTIRFSSVVAQLLAPASESKLGDDPPANDAPDQHDHARPSEPRSPTSDRAPMTFQESLNWLLSRWGTANEPALAVFVEWLVERRALDGAAVLEEVMGEVVVAAAHGSVGEVLDDPGCVALVRGGSPAAEAVEGIHLTLGGRQVLAIKAPATPWLLLLPGTSMPDSTELALVMLLLTVARRIDGVVQASST